MKTKTAKPKTAPAGSRTLAALAMPLDNYKALLAAQQAIFADYAFGEITKNHRCDLSDALNTTVIPMVETSLRLRVSRGMSLASFLGDDHESEPKTLAAKLAAHVDSVISGDTKMNAPAMKLLLTSATQQEQLKQQQSQQQEQAFAAALLNDKDVQQVLAEKMTKIKQEETQQ